MTWFSRLTLNQRLALVAFLLGAIALGARPLRGGAVSIDPRDLALIVQREADHVSVGELADWIMTGRADYRLIDLRSAAAYSEYHLPGAESVPLPSLPEAGLPRNAMLVLYADDGVHAAQGWFLLKAAGYKGVYMVSGGLDAWKKEILFPAIGQESSPNGQMADAKRVAVSRHFGGTPVTATPAAAAPAAPAPAVAMPKAAPPSPAVAKKPAAAPKKKEGC